MLKFIGHSGIILYCNVELKTIDQGLNIGNVVYSIHMTGHSIWCKCSGGHDD